MARPGGAGARPRPASGERPGRPPSIAPCATASSREASASAPCSSWPRARRWGARQRRPHAPRLRGGDDPHLQPDPRRPAGHGRRRPAPGQAHLAQGVRRGHGHPGRRRPPDPRLPPPGRGARGRGTPPACADGSTPWPSSARPAAPPASSAARSRTSSPRARPSPPTPSSGCTGPRRARSSGPACAGGAVLGGASEAEPRGPRPLRLRRGPGLPGGGRRARRHRGRRPARQDRGQGRGGAEGDLREPARPRRARGAMAPVACWRRRSPPSTPSALERRGAARSGPPHRGPACLRPRARSRRRSPPRRLARRVAARPSRGRRPRPW